MFKSLASLVIRFRRVVLLLTMLGAIGSALWGIGVFDRLQSGGFDDPASESSRAIAHLDDELGRSSPDLIVTVESRERTVDDPAYAADVAQAIATLPAGTVTS